MCMNPVRALVMKRVRISVFACNCDSCKFCICPCGKVKETDVSILNVCLNVRLLRALLVCILTGEKDRVK